MKNWLAILPKKWWSENEWNVLLACEVLKVWETKREHFYYSLMPLFIWSFTKKWKHWKYGYHIALSTYGFTRRLKKDIFSSITKSSEALLLVIWVEVWTYKTSGNALCWSWSLVENCLPHITAAKDSKEYDFSHLKHGRIHAWDFMFEKKKWKMYM